MKNLKKNKFFKKAFTLVELIIVIAVIAIIAIFVVPNFTNVLGDTQVTQVKNDTKNISNVVTAYIQEVGAVPVANKNTIASKKTINFGSDATKDFIAPGISSSEFKSKAAKDTYYVIDMDLLTKNVVNVDNPSDKIASKLSSMPSTSAVVDVKEGEANKIDTSKSVKNTSVVYVIDKDLRVYAAYHKDVKKDTEAMPAFKDGNIDDSYVILNPADSHTMTDAVDKVGQSHKTFKVPFKAGAKVEATLDANDSNYN